jgi:hypothetical protein
VGEIFFRKASGHFGRCDVRVCVCVCVCVERKTPTSKIKIRMSAVAYYVPIAVQRSALTLTTLSFEVLPTDVVHLVFRYFEPLIQHRHKIVCRRWLRQFESFNQRNGGATLPLAVVSRHLTTDGDHISLLRRVLDSYPAIRHLTFPNTIDPAVLRQTLHHPTRTVEHLETLECPLAYGAQFEAIGRQQRLKSLTLYRTREYRNDDGIHNWYFAAVDNNSTATPFLQLCTRLERLSFQFCDEPYIEIGRFKVPYSSLIIERIVQWMVDTPMRLPLRALDITLFGDDDAYLWKSVTILAAFLDRCPEMETLRLCYGSSSVPDFRTLLVRLQQPLNKLKTLYISGTSCADATVQIELALLTHCLPALVELTTRQFSFRIQLAHSSADIITVNDDDAKMVVDAKAKQKWHWAIQSLRVESNNNGLWRVSDFEFVLDTDLETIELFLDDYYKSDPSGYNRDAIGFKSLTNLLVDLPRLKRLILRNTRTNPEERAYATNLFSVKHKDFDLQLF